MVFLGFEVIAFFGGDSQLSQVFIFNSNVIAFLG